MDYTVISRVGRQVWLTGERHDGAVSRVSTPGYDPCGKRKGSALLSC